MGIKNLHAAVKHLKRDTHVAALDVSRVAVDASSFMIKGGVRMAREYFLGTLETMPWADYCLDVAIMLKSHGIQPVFVFDGQRLPIKADTCTQRRQTRSQAHSDAEALETEGLVDMAEKKWQQAFVLQKHMEEDTISALTINGIACYVSEYESDQCMAMLWKKGIVDAVITEDSDLLAYGVKKCIFKLKQDGSCEYYGASDTVDGDQTPKKRRVEVMLSLLTDEQIAQMCVLSGTDYNENVPGVGIKKVYTMIRQHSWTECLRLLNVGGTLLEKMTRALDVFLRPERFAAPKTVPVESIQFPDSTGADTPRHNAALIL